VVAPNVGPCVIAPGEPAPVDVGGGKSMVINYKGEILGVHKPATHGYTSGIIDVAALRQFRREAGIGGWVKELKSEIYSLIYQQPIYPKNLYHDSPEKKHADRRRFHHAARDEMVRRGTWSE
jgi:hypothetical protein